MDYPKYVKIEDITYEIDTDFRTAIKCNQIAENEDVSDLERALAIVYMLFGEKGLDEPKNYEKLLEYALKYLSCGKEIQETNEKPDMDYVEDMDYIEASFMSDYKIDLENTKMHWWKFNKLINGLSNSELGNCCILNNVRNLRNTEVSKIKDNKERQKIIKAQEMVALNKNQKKFSKEEEETMKEFDKLARL